MRAIVGFVAIGRNEGIRLAHCLDSIRKVSGKAVYVDSGSSDGSTELAREKGAIVVELDRATPFTAARARNAGFFALVEVAPEVEFVQFVDGDCELAPGWLEAALAILDKEKQAAIVCGRRRERHPEVSRYNWLCDLEWDTPCGEAAACGGDALMRRAPFAEVGGFNPRLMAGEEPELCARLRASGWTILRIDADMTWHDAAMTRFGQWWRRCIRSGFGYAQVWRATKSVGGGLYGREVARAVFWGSLIPIAAFGVAPFEPIAAAALVALYPLQVTRTAMRRGLRRLDSWIHASLMMLAKFAELYGVVRYLVRLGRHSALIEYKVR